MKLLSVAPQEIVVSHNTSGTDVYEFYLKEVQQYGTLRLPVPVFSHNDEVWAIDKNHLVYFARAIGLKEIKAMVLETRKDFEFLRDQNCKSLQINDAVLAWVSSKYADERVIRAISKFNGRICYNDSYYFQRAEELRREIINALIKEGFREDEAVKIFGAIDLQFGEQDRKFYGGYYMTVGDNENVHRGERLLGLKEAGEDWTTQFRPNPSAKRRNSGYPLFMTEILQGSSFERDERNLEYTGLSIKNKELLNAQSTGALVRATRKELINIWNDIAENPVLL
jgi:hypothetical protein